MRNIKIYEDFSNKLDPFDDDNWDDEELTENDEIKEKLIEEVKKLKPNKLVDVNKVINKIKNYKLLDEYYIYDVYDLEDGRYYNNHLDYIMAKGKYMALVLYAIKKNNIVIAYSGFYNAIKINKEKVIEKLEKKIRYHNNKIDKLKKLKKYI